MVRELNACMCRRDCEPLLRHLRTVHISFAVNQNLSVFCANTKRTGNARCPFHAPGVLYSPQVRRKLINSAPLTRCTQTAQHISGVFVYTKLYNVQKWQATFTLEQLSIFNPLLLTLWIIVKEGSY